MKTFAFVLLCLCFLSVSLNGLSTARGSDKNWRDTSLITDELLIETTVSRKLELTDLWKQLEFAEGKIVISKIESRSIRCSKLAIFFEGTVFATCSLLGDFYLLKPEDEKKTEVLQSELIPKLGVRMIVKVLVPKTRSALIVESLEVK